MPKANDGRVRFVTVGDDLKVGFKEAEDRGDDDVERDNNMIGLLRSPLKVMLCPYLNGRGECEGEGDDRLVVCQMK